MVFWKRGRSSGAEVELVVRGRGMIVAGERAAVDAVLAPLAADVESGFGEGREIPVDRLSSTANVAALAQDEVNYVELTVPALQLFTRHHALPVSAEPAAYRAVVSEADEDDGSAEQLTWTTVELSPVQIVATSAAMTQLSARVAVDDVEAPLARLADRFETVAERLGDPSLTDLPEIHRELVRTLDHAYLARVISRSDWERVEPHGEQLVAQAERLRHHAVGLLAPVDPDVGAASRVAQGRALLDGTLADTLDVLLVLDHARAVWEDLRLTFVSVHSIGTLDGAAAESSLALERQRDDDLALVRRLLDTSDRLLRPAGILEFVLAERWKLRSLRSDLLDLLGGFARQRLLPIDADAHQVSIVPERARTVGQDLAGKVAAKLPSRAGVA
ncbi:MAG: hypothetical protein R2705_10550 [Ilumatobacteraceae bacterium]